jgi:transcriptional regulator with XRE-family HTH domain
VKTLTLAKADLDYVFGPESQGETTEARAMSSKHQFIRGQDELSPYDGRGKGRVLTAYEALTHFGLDALKEAMDYGSAILVPDESEPAATLRDRRHSLGLSEAEVARYAGINESDVILAEDSRSRSPIKTLERIARVLALDESVVGFLPGARGDESLALRLKTLPKTSEKDIIYSPHFVLRLADAAWIIEKQNQLQQWLDPFHHQSLLKKFKPSKRYGDKDKPAWMVGYELARSTRKKLGLSPEEPINSIRDLCNKILGVPLLQTELPELVAGVTLRNGADRGIVANIKGANNQNVWVRRMTVAHELGHLLWDPDDYMETVLCDAYMDIEELANPEYQNPDIEAKKLAVEKRANAFAIEFLAPKEQALKIFERSGDLRDVMVHFGIGYVASKYHIWNASKHKVEFDRLVIKDDQPNDEWRAGEDFTLDYFKPESVPHLKRGLFAGVVVKAQLHGLITEDSAAEFLSCSLEEYLRHYKFIKEIFF